MAKTLWVTSDFPPGFSGGISRYVYALACELVDGVVVMSPHYGESRAFDRAQPFSIIRTRVPMGNTLIERLMQTLLLGIQAIAASRRAEVNVVLWGHWYFMFVAPIVRWVTGLPFGVILYGGELDRFKRYSLLRKIMVASLNSAQFLIVISEYTRREFVNLGVVDERIHKILPGVDVNRFTPMVNCRSVIEKHGLEGRKVLLTVSRLVERKGHDSVIRAMPAILEKVPHAIYVVAGAGSQEEYLKSLAVELGVSDQVVFAGYVAEEDLPAYYNMCDVLVMPSRQTEGRESIEGFGIVYLEANACGKPTVGGNSGGVTEAVRDGITGILVDPTNSRAVADAVIHLLLDSNLAQRLGRQGREIVERDHTWRVQANILYALLEGAMRG